MNELFSEAGYAHQKAEALRRLRHAIEQGEKDQWFNALHSIGEATINAKNSLQSIVNRGDWKSEEQLLREAEERHAEYSRIRDTHCWLYGRRHVECIFCGASAGDADLRECPGAEDFKKIMAVAFP